MKQRQMQLATQQALGRERLKYYTGFVILVLMGSFSRSTSQKNALYLAPIVPLGFMWAFQYDLYHGRMMYRVQNEAARILKE